MNYSFDDGGTERHRQEMQRNSRIVLGVVLAAGLGYAGWVFATYESYETCIKQAAKTANGVRSAYLDLRGICDQKEIRRLVETTPATKSKSE